MRRVFAAIFAIGVALCSVAGALAAPDVPNPNRPGTIVLHALGDVFTDTLPCGEDEYEISVTYRTAVIHTAPGDDPFGEDGGTFIENATFEAVPVDAPSLPSFEGSLQAHGRVSIDDAGSNTVLLTQTVRGVGSDGSVINFHETVNAVFTGEGEMLSGFAKAFCK
jgi:hypothetical protein